MKTIRATLSLLMAAAALVRPLATRAQATIDPVASKFYLAPDRAEADKAFVLSTLNHDLYCTLKYYDQSVRVTEGRIDLTFRDSVPDTKIAVLCANRDFGPAFDIPALHAGNYQVYVSPLITCPKGVMCLPVIIPQFAGTLTVGTSAALAPSPASGPRLSGHEERWEFDRSGRVSWRGSLNTLTGRNE
ncbi:MAG: hypothetical protein JWO30_1251 [Fibrobacteres bacterium]|nr:hypothetical protein [Fibrobacterota bacterium]